MTTAYVHVSRIEQAGQQNAQNTLERQVHPAGYCKKESFRLTQVNSLYAGSTWFSLPKLGTETNVEPIEEGLSQKMSNMS